MDIYSQIEKVIIDCQAAVLCIITHTSGSAPRKAGSKMIVLPDGKIIGTIGGGSIEFQAISDALEIMKSGIPTKKVYQLEEDLGMHCGGEVEVYFEPLKCLPDLYIFGAGHIGKQLAGYAQGFGFMVTLIDNREEIFNDITFGAVAQNYSDYATATDTLKFYSNTFSVIVTHKHEYDEQIVTALARKPFAYLGMIGSKRKVAEVKKNMAEKHGFTEEEINKIDMPIGIKMNAETPEEIAISILAKLIDVKNSLDK